MTMPGFTAEAAIAREGRPFRHAAAGTEPAPAQGVVPQALPSWVCAGIGAAILIGEQWELAPLFIRECTTGGLN